MAIQELLGLCSVLEELSLKYNPNWADQERVPAGQPEGGQWTSGGEGEGGTSGAEPAREPAGSSTQEERPETPSGTPARVPEGTFGHVKNFKWSDLMSAQDKKEALRGIKAMFGKKVPLEHVLSLAGVQDGSHVILSYLKFGDEKILSIEHQSPDVRRDKENNVIAGYAASRNIVMEGNQKFIHNTIFKGAGAGIPVFGRQVEAATQLGFSHIETDAAGEGNPATGRAAGEYNGYYTWPRMGYNADLSRQSINELPVNLTEQVARAGGKVSGLMATEEGRKWWQGNGRDLGDAKFDLKEGSYSHRTLAAYLQERGILDEHGKPRPKPAQVASEMPEPARPPAGHANQPRVQDLQTPTPPAATVSPAAPIQAPPAPTPTAPVAPTPGFVRGPAPDHVPEGTFGVSKDLAYHPSVDVEAMHAAARSYLGRNATAEDLASIAGAPDGATITGFKRSLLTGLQIDYERVVSKHDPDLGSVQTQLYQARRTITRSLLGNVSMHNEFVVGEGHGLPIFARQVENAAKWGINTITTHAAGHGNPETGKAASNYNGYYTWPRFGYDARIPRGTLRQVPDELKEQVRAAGNKVSGLMATSQGRDWWKGNGDSLDATFDVRKGSYSQKTLAAYLQEKGHLKAMEVVEKMQTLLALESLLGTLSFIRAPESNFSRDVSLPVRKEQDYCRDDQGRFDSCEGGGGDGGGGNETGREPNEQERAQGEWQDRQDVRDEQHDKIDAVYDEGADYSDKMNEAHSTLQELDTEAGEPEKARQGTLELTAAFADHWAGVRQRLAEVGASDADLTGFDRARARGEAVLKKDGEQVVEGHDKVSAAFAEHERHAEQEPEEPAEPEYPEHPGYPEEPQDNGNPNYEQEHQRWQQQADKIDAEHEREEQRIGTEHDREYGKWQRTYDRWEAQHERLGVKLSNAHDKLENLHGRLNEHLSDHHAAVDAKAYSLSEKLHARIRKQEDADPEPE